VTDDERLRDYEALRREHEAARRRADRDAGAAAELLAELRREFGVKTPEAAAKLLAAAEAEAKAAAAAYDKARAAYRREFEGEGGHELAR